MPAELSGIEVPEGPAVYCWWEGDQPLHIAVAAELREQLLGRDTRAFQRPVPPFRRLVRDRLELRGQLPGTRAGRGRRAEAIDAYIADCAVSWVAVETLAQAESLAVEASEELLDADQEPRPGEDRWLHQYLEGHGDHGRVYLEVPFGARQGGRRRRIDAVRFAHRPTAVRAYDEGAFTEDLASGVADRPAARGP